MKRHIIIAACMALGLMVATPAALATQPWQQVSQGTWLNDVAYGAGRYVATGYTGIYTSTDGLTWQQVLLPANATSDYHRILWNAAQNQFVTVGYLGAVLTSPDGLNWSVHSTGASTLDDLIYANGQYVAVSSNGLVVTSPDGNTWALHSTPADSNSQLLGIAWNGSRYIAAGRCITTTCTLGEDIVLASTDGANWTSVDIGTTGNPVYADGIAWGNGEFVISGLAGVLTSLDGSTWTRQVLNPDFAFSASNNNALRFEDGHFVGTGFDRSPTPRTTTVFTSTDGTNWAASHVPDPFSPDSDVTAAELIGGTYYMTASDGSIFSTPDLADWTTNRTGSVLGNDQVSGAAYGAGLYLTYVAPDPVSSAYVSLDGITWTQQGTRAGGCYGLAYGAGTFVCSALYAGELFTSPNQDNWVARTAGIGANTLVNKILASANGFIAVGYDTSGGTTTSAVLTSPDGSTWTPQPSAAVAGVMLNQVVAGIGGYFALGDNTDSVTNAQTPYLLFSPDGISWTVLAPDWPNDFNPSALVGQAGLLIAAGTNYRSTNLCPPGACQTEIFSSTDGTHWTEQNVGSLGIPDASYWNGGIYGGSLFEIYGTAGDNGNLVFVSSHDGVHWTYTTLPASFAGAALPNSILWSGDQFVTAVGEGGIFRLPGVSLSLSMRARPRVHTRRRFRYVLRVQNTDASQAATGVTVNDNLPPGVQFLSARIRRASGSCSASGQMVTCALSGALPAGARARIVLRVQSPNTAGTIVNEASAISDFPVTDGSSSSAGATTTVVCHGRHCTP